MYQNMPTSLMNMKEYVKTLLAQLLRAWGIKRSVGAFIQRDFAVAVVSDSKGSSIVVSVGGSGTASNLNMIYADQFFTAVSYDAQSREDFEGVFVNAN